MAILISVIGVVALVGAMFALMFIKLASRLDKQADTAEWFESFSADNFAPMERLLDRSDFTFLSRQPGYRPEIGARLLGERKKLFLSYLNNLISDFNQLLRIARLMIVQSPVDRADFARSLWRQQVTFYFTVCTVRVRVALYPLGWTSLDVSKLIQSLENMRSRVTELALPPMASPQSA